MAKATQLSIIRMAFQILSLSGGECLGLYTVTVLAELEKAVARPLTSSCDLLAGRSVVWIIALALAAEIPAETIKTTFESRGAAIFSNRAAPVGTIARKVDFLRSFFRSKYGDRALRETVEQIIGTDTLIEDLS